MYSLKLENRDIKCMKNMNLIRCHDSSAATTHSIHSSFMKFTLCLHQILTHVSCPSIHINSIGDAVLQPGYIHLLGIHTKTIRSPDTIINLYREQKCCCYCCCIWWWLSHWSRAAHLLGIIWFYYSWYIRVNILLSYSTTKMDLIFNYSFYL